MQPSLLMLRCRNLLLCLFALKWKVPWRPCEDCVGSGICSECKGEGFVLKKMSEGSAERARLTAKNMATRYTTSQEMETAQNVLPLDHVLLVEAVENQASLLVLLKHQCCFWPKPITMEDEIQVSAKGHL